MLRKTIFAATAAVCAAGLTVPAAAQQNGLVNVSVTDLTILNNFLNNAEILRLTNVLNNNTLQVQVPIGIAANICNVSAAVLGRSGSSAGKCTATSGSAALARAVRKQKLGMKK